MALWRPCLPLQLRACRARLRLVPTPCFRAPPSPARLPRAQAQRRQAATHQGAVRHEERVSADDCGSGGCRPSGARRDMSAAILGCSWAPFEACLCPHRPQQSHFPLAAARGSTDAQLCVVAPLLATSRARPPSPLPPALHFCGRRSSASALSAARSCPPSAFLASNHHCTPFYWTFNDPFHDLASHAPPP